MNILNKKYSKKKKDFKGLRKNIELAGIEDLMVIYEEYQKLMQISMNYLKEMDIKFSFSTTDRTS